MESYKREFIEFSVMFCLLPLKIPIKLVFMRFVWIVVLTISYRNLSLFGAVWYKIGTENGTVSLKEKHR